MLLTVAHHSSNLASSAEAGAGSVVGLDRGTHQHRSTMAGISLAQRLGSGTFTGITLSASIVMCLLSDHFGGIGFMQHSASWQRTLGGAFMIAGLWLVARF